jgi:hypothetical protein
MQCLFFNFYKQINDSIFLMLQAFWLSTNNLYFHGNPYTLNP